MAIECHCFTRQYLYFLLGEITEHSGLRWVFDEVEREVDIVSSEMVEQLIWVGSSVDRKSFKPQTSAPYWKHLSSVIEFYGPGGNELSFVEVVSSTSREENSIDFGEFELSEFIRLIE